MIVIFRRLYISVCSALTMCFPRMLSVTSPSSSGSDTDLLANLIKLVCCGNMKDIVIGDIISGSASNADVPALEENRG